MTRKKVLLISYYYPPCNSIASLRPASLANEFSKYYDVKVITRSWLGDENSWFDYLKGNSSRKTSQINKNLEVIQTPYISKVINKNFLSFLKVIKHNIKGEYNFEVDTLQFLPAIEMLFTTWKPDIILVSSPPLNLLKLAFLLNKKYRVPYILDFRDFQNEMLLNDNFKHNFKSWLDLNIQNKLIKKYFKAASSISVINAPIQKYFKNHFEVDSNIILNGFEEHVFNNFKPSNIFKTNAFTLSLIGTVYSHQNIDILIDGIKMFTNQKPNYFINFIGLNAVPEVAKYISSKLDDNFIIVTARIPRENALKIMENSNVLIYMGWKGYSGVYSGKIFEYLGAKRNILIAPSDKNVIESLLLETNAGEVANNPLEVCAYLERKYSEWEQKGLLDYHGFDDKIAFYSRENQAKILLDKIEETLQWK
jgi:glycosyltransferase involved in cell wall biosynthesis